MELNAQLVECIYVISAVDVRQIIEFSYILLILCKNSCIKTYRSHFATLKSQMFPSKW